MVIILAVPLGGCGHDFLSASGCGRWLGRSACRACCTGVSDMTVLLECAIGTGGLDAEPLVLLGSGFICAAAAEHVFPGFGFEAASSLRLTAAGEATPLTESEQGLGTCPSVVLESCSGVPGAVTKGWGVGVPEPNSGLRGHPECAAVVVVF